MLISQYIIGVAALADNNTRPHTFGFVFLLAAIVTIGFFTIILIRHTEEKPWKAISGKRISYFLNFCNRKRYHRR